MFESLMGDRKPLANNKSLSHKKVKTDLRKVVGARFILAREMNGLSQSQAALKIGYKNPTQLCLWEQSKRLPPIDQMIIAALIYGVSLDYLYGLSDEPEKDPRTAAAKAMVHQMQDMLTANAQAVSNAMMIQARSGGPCIATVTSLHSRAADAANSIRKFKELNKLKFDNLRGGNTLMVAMAALDECTETAIAIIHRQEKIKENAIKTQENTKKLSYPLFGVEQYAIDYAKVAL